VYSKVHEEEQEKIRRASQASKDVQRQAETVKSIDSNVKGLQTLASQNLSLQAVLGDISTSISRANQIAAEESRLDKEQSKRELDETQRRLTELDRISESYKPDNRIKLPSEHSKPKK
jgi:DNA repair ATPase RecN